MTAVAAVHRRRPRILLAVSSFPQPTEAFTLGKIRELLPRGWDLHIACTHLDDAAWNAVPGMMSDRDRATRVHVVDWSRESLLDLGPDLVNIEYITLAQRVLQRTRRLPVPTLVGIRGAETIVPPNDASAYAPVWTHATALHLVARGLWAEALARGCSPSMPHYVINAAVDTAFWSAVPRNPLEHAGTPGRPLRLVCVTRMHWVKGVPWLLQALGTIRSGSPSTTSGSRPSFVAMAGSIAPACASCSAAPMSWSTRRCPKASATR